MQYLESFGGLLGYALAYPLLGLVVTAAGWSVGEVLRVTPTHSLWGTLSRYGHLFGLGLTVHAIAWAVYGSP